MLKKCYVYSKHTLHTAEIRIDPRCGSLYARCPSTDAWQITVSSHTRAKLPPIESALSASTAPTAMPCGEVPVPLLHRVELRVSVNGSGGYFQGLPYLHVLMMKSFGFPAKPGQLSLLKFSSREDIVTNCRSLDSMTSLFP